MLSIDVLVGVPFSREERILLTDYFAVEESGQFRVFVGQAVYLQITAQIGVFLVDVLKTERIRNRAYGALISGMWRHLRGF